MTFIATAPASRSSPSNGSLPRCVPARPRPPGCRCRRPVHPRPSGPTPARTSGHAGPWSRARVGTLCHTSPSGRSRPSAALTPSALSTGRPSPSAARRTAATPSARPPPRARSRTSRRPRGDAVEDAAALPELVDARPVTAPAPTGADRPRAARPRPRVRPARSSAAGPGPRPAPARGRRRRWLEPDHRGHPEADDERGREVEQERHRAITTPTAINGCGRHSAGGRRAPRLAVVQHDRGRARRSVPPSRSGDPHGVHERVVVRRPDRPRVADQSRAARSAAACGR